MRVPGPGGCTAQQQALSPEAATVVKQAVTLSRRRGHAQVTPLHVATAMLSSSSAAGAILRAACLRSHFHPPLHCKALELCFNVALNRLSGAASSIYHHPSLSNALVAAFKRAHAHQRRYGSSVDTGQHHHHVVKIELDQLVISILDDPSVSRVMREAGFSSTQVKSNVQNAVGNTASPPPAPASPAMFVDPRRAMMSSSSDVGISLGLSLMINTSQLPSWVGSGGDCFEPITTTSEEDSGGWSKRSRIVEASDGYVERFFAAVREEPRRVFFLEGVDRVGGYSRRCIRRAIEQGKVRSSSGEEVAVGVLSCERFERQSTPSSPPSKQAPPESDGGEEEEERGKESAGFSFDLNLCASADNDVDAVDDEDLAESVDRALFFDLQKEGL